MKGIIDLLTIYNGLPVTGLTLSDFKVNVYRVKISDNSLTHLVENAAMTVEVGGGFYRYTVTIDPTLYDYLATVLYDGEESLASSLWFMEIDAKVGSRTALQAGAIEKVYTVRDEDSGLPIADVDVWVTTGEEGANMIASGKTDADGEVTFYLDAGTVHIWRQKSGYNFDNPDTEVVA